MPQVMWKEQDAKSFEGRNQNTENSLVIKEWAGSVDTISDSSNFCLVASWRVCYVPPACALPNPQSYTPELCLRILQLDDCTSIKFASYILSPASTSLRLKPETSANMSSSVMLRNVYLYIVITLLLAAAAIGASASDLCLLDRYPYLNATVSQTVPALQPNYSLHPPLAGNLAISTGVKKFRNESGGFTEQLFWMKSDPPITDPDNNISFRTCAFFLLGLELSAINGTELVGADPHNEGCSVALPPECEQTMVSGLRSNASFMFSNENFDISDTLACTKLAESALDPRSLPECSGYDWNIVGTSCKLRSMLGLSHIY